MKTLGSFDACVLVLTFAHVKGMVCMGVLFSSAVSSRYYKDERVETCLYTSKGSSVHTHEIYEPLF